MADDVRELEIPSPELTRENARINALFGGQADRTVYLTYGGSVTDARASLEKLETWLQSAGGGRTRTIGLVPLCRPWRCTPRRCNSGGSIRNLRPGCAPPWPRGLR